MQAQTLYGSRGRAAFHSLVPLLVMLFIVSQVFRGSDSGPSLFIVAVFLLLGITRIGDLVRPRQLVLDEGGVTFHPSFKATRPKIAWSAVRGFAIEGSKNKLLVLNYVEGGEARRLALGTDWCLDNKSLWGVSLVRALAHVSDYQQGAMVRTAAAATPQKVAMATAHTSPPKVSQPSQPVATTRSGVVYAEPVRAQARPPAASLNGETKSLTGPGWGLLAGGAVVAALSLVPFMAACKRGLCSVGLWEMGDYRLWLFALLWIVCLLAILAGWKMIGSARERGL